MFSKQEKDEIELNLKKLLANPKRTKKSVLRKASAGIYPSISKTDSLTHLYKRLIDAVAQSEDQKLYPKDDSTSAWMHQATSQFGLTAGDIRKMKFGQTINVLFMDRNVGDYTSGVLKREDTFDPSKIGFSYGTYIHGKDLTGLLNFTNVGVVLAPFTWEVNLGALGSNLYWGPIDGCECKDGDDKPPKIPDEILVGWRGPSIDMENLRYLPNKIKIYDTWWDDYGITKYNDWMHYR